MYRDSVVGLNPLELRPPQFHTRYIMKFVSKDSYEYSDEWGEGEKPMELGMSGKDTRVAATKPATSKPAQ